MDPLVEANDRALCANINKLDKFQLQDFASRVTQTLFPLADPNTSWSPDTLDALGALVQDFGLISGFQRDE